MHEGKRRARVVLSTVQEQEETSVIRFETTDKDRLSMQRPISGLVICSPRFRPSDDAFDVLVHLCCRLARQLDDDLFRVRVPRFLGDDLHDFGVVVLLYLVQRVASLLEAFPEERVVAREDDNEVNPSLGKQITRVPVDNLAALSLYQFQLVQQLSAFSQQESILERG